jgi:glutamyl-tRNA reductase
VRLVALGIDHTKASATMRESVAVSADRMPEALRTLRKAHPGHEFTILSTCNRVEIYAATDESRLAPNQKVVDPTALAGFLADFHGLSRAELLRHASVHADEGVVGHLFRVAASVESVVLGEGQILGQVREAYRLATASQSVGWVLHAVFQHALRVGKKVRETTGLGSGKLSVASVAVDLAREVFDHFDDKTVLVVGAGKMAELTLTHLSALKPGRTLVTNRSAAKAKQLADRFGGSVVEFDRLNQALIEADVVVSTTASTQPIMTLETYARIQKARRYRLALILDIAIPRDFDDRIGQLDQVMLYNVDDLRAQVERTMSQRRGGLSAAHRLIDTEVAACLAALRHQKEASSILKALGEHADELRETELSALFERCPNLTETERQAVQRMAFRLQNQLLHEPRAALRSRARSVDETRYTLAEAVADLFGLIKGHSYRRKSDGRSPRPNPEKLPIQEFVD